MNFFNIDAGESDYEEEYEVEEVVESRINPYWYEVTDDEDETEHKEVRSREEKLIDELTSECDKFDALLEYRSWVQASEKFNTMCDLAQTAKTRFKVVPRSFLECLQNMPSLDEELEGKSREDFENKKSYNALKVLITKVASVVEEYAGSIKALDEEEMEGGEASSGEDDGNELSEEGYATELTDIASSRAVNLVSRVEKVIRACGRQGYANLETSAMGIAVTAVLSRDSRKLFVASDTWSRAYKWATRFLDRVLNESSSARFVEDSSTVTSKNVCVPGGMSGFLQLLHRELRNKSKFEELISAEYANVLQFENNLAVLTDRALGYYQSKRKVEPMKVCTSLLLDIMGQRRQAAHDLFLSKEGSTDSFTAIRTSTFETVRGLQSLSLSLSASTEVTVSGACHVAYQYGLSGKYREGRDYLLRNGIASKVDTTNATLAILFNRAIAQLGLAAFIAGDVETSHELLSTVWKMRSNYVLLGQGMPPRSELPDERADLEYRTLLLPQHLYISTTQLELAAILSGLLVGVKQEAQNPFERNRMERYVFNAISFKPALMGTPSSFHEQVGATYASLKAGNYSDAKKHVEAMTVFTSLPNGEKTRLLYLEKMKEAALIIFCHANRCNFSTLSVPQLAIKYDMQDVEVRRIVNEMLSDNGVLSACWDREDAYLYLDRNNSTRMQHLIKSTADGISALSRHCESRIRAAGGRDRGRGGAGRGAGRGAGGGRGGGRGAGRGAARK